jgi:hypothetical protein
LDFGKRTKAIDFADDLLIAVKAGTAKETENFANIEISKITNGQQTTRSNSKVKINGNH